MSGFGRASVGAAMSERRFEWPTLALLFGCYGLWITGTLIWWPVGLVLITLAAALHSSLTHEVLHGHPFRSCFWNAALVFPPLTLVVPYLRFKDTHLAHHREPLLTDPYDDPETNFLDPEVWGQQARWKQALLQINNTLAGRMLLGPAIGTWAFWKGDWALIRGGDRRVILGWVLHLAGLPFVLAWVAYAGMPIWAFLLGTYASLSILKIRTFLEHRAHEAAPGRSVIIEDRGPLALIFLNNNLHAVHHLHGSVAWYDLPRLYRENKARYVERNAGYVYRSYGEIFRRYFLRAKDPVPHPLWSKD